MGIFSRLASPLRSSVRWEPDPTVQRFPETEGEIKQSLEYGKSLKKEKQQNPHIVHGIWLFFPYIHFPYSRHFYEIRDPRSKKGPYRNPFLPSEVPWVFTPLKPLNESEIFSL